MQTSKTQTPDDHLPQQQDQQQQKVAAESRSDEAHHDDNPTNEPEQKLTFFQMAFSIMAAFIGVQKNKNRERDFKHGKAVHFIIIGILMTALWYLAIAAVVSIVLKDV